MNSQKLTSKIELLSSNKRALLFAELSQIAYYEAKEVKKISKEIRVHYC